MKKMFQENGTCYMVVIQEQRLYDQLDYLSRVGDIVLAAS
jgi:hypothetical protein